MKRKERGSAFRLPSLSRPANKWEQRGAQNVLKLAISVPCQHSYLDSVVRAIRLGGIEEGEPGRDVAGLLHRDPLRVRD